jgi:hypothetical protein
VVASQGVAPHLVELAPASGLPRILPTHVQEWLAELAELNRRRIDRMLGELATILRAAADAGVAVMPLKGALLATLPGFGAHRRPMADLDLLVRPVDRQAMAAVLARLGYTFEDEHNPRPTHDTFVDPGGGRLVSPHGDHPDNPRRVEVHVEVKRHLWAWDERDDLTSALWRGAQAGRVVGEPAFIPRFEALFAHLAIHATSDLLVGRGRLVQWLDLGFLAARAAETPGGLAPERLPHPRTVYPALRLAARALPRQMAGLQLGALEREVPSRLARWAAAVPLDGSCGLQGQLARVSPSTWRARVQRWAPQGWRLAVAYGDMPLPAALARHGLRIGEIVLGRLSRPR